MANTSMAEDYLKKENTKDYLYQESTYMKCQNSQIYRSKEEVSGCLGCASQVCGGKRAEGVGQVKCSETAQPWLQAAQPCKYSQIH